MEFFNLWLVVLFGGLFVCLSVDIFLKKKNPYRGLKFKSGTLTFSNTGQLFVTVKANLSINAKIRLWLAKGLVKLAALLVHKLKVDAKIE